MRGNNKVGIALIISARKWHNERTLPFKSRKNTADVMVSALPALGWVELQRNEMGMLKILLKQKAANSLPQRSRFLNASSAH